MNLKRLDERVQDAFDLKQKHDPAIAKFRVLEFVKSLDRRISYNVIGTIPNLAFLHTRDEGAGVNAVLQCLGIRDFSQQTSRTSAESAATSVLTTLGHVMPPGRKNRTWFWNMGIVLRRALSARSSRPVDDITYNRLIPSLQMMEAGVWIIKAFDAWTSYVPIPEVHHEDGIPHCETGPAFKLYLPEQKIEEWFLQGVRLTEKIVLRPETQTIEEIESEGNTEVKRIRIERMGWEKYLQVVKAENLGIKYNERDSQWESLYRLPDGTNRFCVSDPSTGRKYALPVPAEIQTCEQAQEWMSFDLDKITSDRS